MNKKILAICIMVGVVLLGLYIKFDRDAKDGFESIETFLTEMDTVSIGQKIEGNTAIVITENNEDDIVINILMKQDKNGRYQPLVQEKVKPSHEKISYSEHTYNNRSLSCNFFTLLIINDDVLVEKGGAIYYELGPVENEYLETSFVIRPQITPMDKHKVYIRTQGIYTKSNITEEEASLREVKELTINTITITDNGGSVLYKMD